MDELNILNVLGQNDEAQEALREILSSKYPTLESEFNLSAQIIDKYFDWYFNFEYTADGGGLKRWKTVINSYCGRHPKLNVLQKYFDDNDTKATLEEVYSGEDVTDFTDNRESTAATGFNAVGNNSTTTGLSNEVTSKFTDGKNTTRNVFKHGQKRTYADGRTWTEIFNDIETVQAPIYKFINGWANVLLQPCEDIPFPCDCFPTVSATASASQGEAAAVKVRNIGTPTNAQFDFEFVLPKGADGITPDFKKVDSDILPRYRGAYNLGGRTKPWKTLHTKELNICYEQDGEQKSTKILSVLNNGNRVYFDGLNGSSLVFDKNQSGEEKFDINVGQAGFHCNMFNYGRDAKFIGWNYRGEEFDFRKYTFNIAEFVIQTNAFDARFLLLVDGNYNSETMLNSFNALYNYLSKRDSKAYVLSGKIRPAGGDIMYDIRSINASIHAKIIINYYEAVTGETDIDVNSWDIGENDVISLDVRELDTVGMLPAWYL